MPFEGLIRNREGGIEVVYHPEKEIDINLHLELVHGTWDVMPEVAIQELSFDVDYSSSEKRVQCSKVLGKIPSKFQHEGYFLNGKEIELQLGANGLLQFDVRLENQVMDLIRCVGSYDLQKREFAIDTAKSHFFTIYPTALELALDDGYLPKNGSLSLEVPIHEMENFVKIALDMKVPCDFLLEVFDAIPDSEASVQIKVNGSLGALEIDLVGDQFKCRLEKQGALIKLVHLNVCGFELSGEIEQRGGLYQISDLKGISESSVFSFVDAYFDPAAQRITLPIQGASVDIQECFPKLGTGRVAFGGMLEIDFSKGVQGAFLEGRIKIDGEKDQVHLASLSDLYLMYTVDQGIVIKESIFEVSLGNARAQIEVPFCSYSFEDAVFQGYQIKTSYGDGEIEAFLKKTGLQVEIPKDVSGKTKVTFDIELAKDRFQISGFCGEGTYSWKGKVLTMKEVRWFYDKTHLEVEALFPFCGSEFSIHAKVYPDDLGLAIIEGYEKGVSERALYAECLLFNPEGNALQKFQGNLFGIEFQFLPSNKLEDWTFLGDVKIDVARLKDIAGPDVKELIEEMKFEKGYELKGELKLKKDDLAASVFEGYLKGRDFDMLGYLFKTLLGSIRIDQRGVVIRDLSISDEGVTVTIPELKIEVSAKGDLNLRIPELKIDELRPSLLKKKHGKERLKPFCIKTMVFQDISGNLANEKSFTGRGNLKFINTFKEGHNLLDIPIEIISRLGLDIGLLVPIQGELDYVLKNGKLVFTKLKNSFSDNKRSYFYLWNKSESYIDFEGNMHIDIRMKQYVLFKITELFILSIQGSLDKPKCFLR